MAADHRGGRSARGQAARDARAAIGDALAELASEATGSGASARGVGDGVTGAFGDEDEPPERPTPPGRMSLNLTPMIDVVFQLLIYFMVATNFSLGEQIFRMDLPARAGAAAADPFELKDEPLRVRVRSAPGGPAIRLEGPYEQPADLDALAAFLAANIDGPRALFRRDYPIEVVPDGDARWEDVVGVFNTVVGAGCTHASIRGSGI